MILDLGAAQQMRDEVQSAARQICEADGWSTLIRNHHHHLLPLHHSLSAAYVQYVPLKLQNVSFTFPPHTMSLAEQSSHLPLLVLSFLHLSSSVCVSFSM